MDSRLDSYLDQQDRDYTACIESDNGTEVTPQDEATYLLYEIRAIVKILATDKQYGLVTPDQWYERLSECRARLGRLLQQEQKTIQGTIDLHCQGLIACNTRRIEIEGQLAEVGI